MAIVGAAHRLAAQLCAALEGGLRAVCPLAADKGLFLEGVAPSDPASLQLASNFILNYSPVCHVKTIKSASKNRLRAERQSCTDFTDFLAIF